MQTDFQSVSEVKTEVQPAALSEVYPVPINEDARQAALNDLNILDTPNDERFDRIVRIAATHFQTPMARITFVDKDRTWYKSCVGSQATESPRNIAICARTVMQNDVLLVPDLQSDPTFSNLPQVKGPPYLRFYAGAPIILKSGFRVGSLCLIDFEPRHNFDKADISLLQDLAAIAANELQLHQQLSERSEELKQTGSELSVAKTAKDRFLSIAGHELKTPLNGILGFGEMIMEDARQLPDGEKCGHYAQQVVASARHLNGLVDRILAYSSAETGDIRLVEEIFSWKDLLQGVVDNLSGDLAQKKLGVNLQIDANAPLKVYGDKVQMHEIVMQILCNAVAFSERESNIALSLDLCESGGVVIRCEDHGVGMDEEMLSYLMQPFTQAQEALTRSHGGIGLGLPISKAMTELHGGRFDISSRKGDGTTVRIYLPASRNR